MLVLLLTITCLLGSASAHRFGEFLERTDGSKCCERPFEESKTCCPLPDLLPEDTLKGCDGTTPKPTQDREEVTKSSEGSVVLGDNAKLKSSDVDSERQNSGWGTLKKQKWGRGHRRERSPGHGGHGPWGRWGEMRHGGGREDSRDPKSESRRQGGWVRWDNQKRAGTPCQMECVFKNQSLFSRDEEGVINVTRAAEVFKVTDTTWQKVVQDAVQNCSDQLKLRGKKSSSTPSDGPSCNLTASMFMKCVKRSMILSCPEGSVNDPERTCGSKFDKVSACDPFALPPTSGSQRDDDKEGKDGNRKNDRHPKKYNKNLENEDPENEDDEDENNQGHRGRIGKGRESSDKKGGKNSENVDNRKNKEEPASKKQNGGEEPSKMKEEKSTEVPPSTTKKAKSTKGKKGGGKPSLQISE